MTSLRLIYVKCGYIIIACGIGFIGHSRILFSDHNDNNHNIELDTYLNIPIERISSIDLPYHHNRNKRP